jgi:hypothetical protein
LEEVFPVYGVVVLVAELLGGLGEPGEEVAVVEGLRGDGHGGLAGGICTDFSGGRSMGLFLWGWYDGWLGLDLEAEVTFFVGGGQMGGCFGGELAE